MRYTVVIRTLGKSGLAYKKTLESVMTQTIIPESIIVYIAEGCFPPDEPLVGEQYVFVSKGMVAQRALKYDEVKTEYCLFLDDDVFLPEDAVEKLYAELVSNDAHVISPCTFYNHKVSLKSKIRGTLLGKEVSRIKDDEWAFKVLRTAGFSYNNNPTQDVYESQSNAGPCFLCRKEDFLSIAYDEELWLDATYYALPDDQVMFYKMYKKGLKILTSFDSGVVHLDAGSTLINSPERNRQLVFSEYRNKLIFWHRFIYRPEKSFFKRIWAILAISYAYGIQATKYSIMFLLGKRPVAKAFFDGIRDALGYLKSEQYHKLPLV